jgi:hypothetical protein
MQSDAPPAKLFTFAPKRCISGPEYGLEMCNGMNIQKSIVLNDNMDVYMFCRILAFLTLHNAWYFKKDIYVLQYDG